MAKAYSLLSWNVEHFREVTGAAHAQRLQRIVDTIKSADNGNGPDVFALYEVEGSEVFEAMTAQFPGYSFHITEGPQTQEILVAVRGSITAFFTQRVEFKTGLEYLRPGALLTLTIDGEHYPILFLHLKSAADPRSFGLRDDMLRRAAKFAKTLRTNGQNANYLFIGDMNTMGLDYYYDRDISPEVELRKSDQYARQYQHLVRLEKTYAHTWWNGSGSMYDPADLDHCYAADHLQFKLFNNIDRPGQSPVGVFGWAEQPTPADKDQWIAEHSDHSYLYLEVQKV